MDSFGKIVYFSLYHLTYRNRAMNTHCYFCFLFILCLWSTPSNLYGQFVINEVHAAPTAGEPEWIELYNTHNQTRILRNGFINDRTTTRKLPDIRIPAHGYALLTRDTTALRESRSFPSSTVLVELSLPSLNNSTDIVVLRDADSTVLDSLYYNLKWGAKGISLERIDAHSAAVSAENLAPSESPDSASAGAVNSVVLLNYDARLTGMRGHPDSTVVLVGIQNNGSTMLSSCTVSLYFDNNGNDSLETGELRGTQRAESLTYKEQIFLRFFTGSVSPGYKKSVAIVDFPPDERRYNDTLHARVFLSPAAHALRINEFMFQPLPSHAEYVELWNTSADTLPLEGWVLHDRATSTGADTLRIAHPVFIAPQQYIAIAWDSVFFQQFPHLYNSPYAYCRRSSLRLNSTGDDIVLRDPNGARIDSLSYSPTWHIVPPSAAAGHSLEKINPALPSERRDAWTTSGDARGGTPAQENSVAIPLRTEGVATASPNPFSPSKGEICAIAYQLPYRLAHISIALFNTNGIPVRQLFNTQFTSGEGFAAWNGRNDNNETLPSGPYVAVVEAVDIATGDTSTQKIVVVLAP